MGFSLGPEGLSTSTQEEIKAERLDRYRATWGQDIDEETAANIIQMLNIDSEYLAKYQQVTLAVYRSFDPAGAIGAALSARRALTGSIKRAAYGSTVTIAVTFGSAGSVENGDVIHNVPATGDGAEWEAYGGPYVSAGPWPETLQGVTYRCTATGPTPALQSSVWESVSGNAGATVFFNVTDAILGDVVETDAAFRVRSQREIYASGHGPLAAINALVSRAVVPSGPGAGSVVFSRVYHNPRINPVDADGIPFKAFNVAVRTNPDPPTAELQQAIWDAIFSGLGAGGEAYGTDYVGTSVDSEGVAHKVAFDLVVDVPMRIRLYLTTGTSEVAVTPNLKAIVAAELFRVAQLSHRVAGRDVLALDYTGVVNDLIARGLIKGVDGVRSLVSAVGDSAFVTTKRPIGIREIPSFALSRTVVSQE